MNGYCDRCLTPEKNDEKFEKIVDEWTSDKMVIEVCKHCLQSVEELNRQWGYKNGK